MVGHRNVAFFMHCSAVLHLIATTASTVVLIVTVNLLLLQLPSKHLK